MTKTRARQKPIQRFNSSTVQRFNAPSAEICILAGGLSKRMGRDKSRLRLGSTTMLGHIRKTVRATGLPARVIRSDCVPKCGPLGGIYTALKTTKAEAVLFLACDMPLLSAELIQFVLQQSVAASRNTRTSLRAAVFVRSRGVVGFPFVLRGETVEKVRQQIEKADYSLQSLAKALKATILSLARPCSRQLFNVNTPDDWAEVGVRLPRGRRGARRR